MIIRVVKIFLYSSSVYSYHLFLVSSASVRPLPFPSFIKPIFPWNVPLASLIFLKRSLVFPILSVQFSSVHFSCSVVSDSVHSFLLFLFTDHWGRLIAPCNSLKQPSGGYISFPPLLFASFILTAICKAYSDGHFAFLHYFFLEMVLLRVSWTMSGPSTHSSSGTLSIRSRPLNLFLTSTV